MHMPLNSFNRYTWLLSYVHAPTAPQGFFFFSSTIYYPQMTEDNFVHVILATKYTWPYMWERYTISINNQAGMYDVWPLN